MKKYTDKFVAKALKVSGIQLDEADVVADEKFHLVDGQHFYVLSTLKPPVGFFGHIGCTEPEKWALRRKTDKDEKAYKEKCMILTETVKQGLSRVHAGHQTLLPSAAGKSGDEVVIKRLAALSLCEYDRVRKPDAAKLGVRVSVLDKAVEKARRGISANWPSKPSSQLEFDL